METARIPHVEGNVLKLAIPLTLQTIIRNNGETSTRIDDYIPSSNYPVWVEFTKGIVKHRLRATMQDNVAFVEDKGKMRYGKYDIAVLCNDDNGDPRKFKQRTVLEVFEYTADAGLPTGVEFNSETHWLDAAVFIAYNGGNFEETDPTVPQHVKSITQSDIDKWNNKPDKQRTVLYMTASRTPSFTDVDGNALTHSQVRELLNSSKELDVLIYFAEQLYPCILALSQPDQWYFAVIYTGDEAGYLRIYYDERTGIYHDFYTMQFVPYSRKVNNKPLSNDITLSASDVGAMPVGTFIPALANNLTTTVANYALDARQGKVLSDLISQKLSYAYYTDEDERDSDSEERHMCYIEDTGFFLYDFVAGEWVQISTGGKGIAGISTQGEGDIVIALDNGDTYSLNLNHTHTNLAQKNGSEDESFTSNLFRVADGGRSGEGVDVTSFFDDSEEVVMLTFSDSWNGSTLNYAFSQDKPADAFIATEEFVREFVNNRLITPIVTNSSSGSVTQNLEPNKFYKFTGALTALTIGLPLVSSGGLDIFFGKFTAGTGGCTFGYPSSVNPAPSVPSTFEEGKTYEFSIMDNELFIVEA